MGGFFCIFIIIFSFGASAKDSGPRITKGWDDEGVPVYKFLKPSYVICKQPGLIGLQEGCKKRLVKKKERHKISLETSRVIRSHHVHTAKKDFSFVEYPDMKLTKGTRIQNRGYAGEGSFKVIIGGKEYFVYIGDEFSDRLTGIPYKSKVDQWIFIEAIDKTKGWVYVNSENFKEVDRIFN